MNYFVNKVLPILIAILLPFIILMGGVRAIMTPAFAAGEYRRASVPEDAYGFSHEERLKWATYAITYLVNNQGINYLGDLQTTDGQPLFNPSELGHMEDVKQVVKTASTVWYGAMGFVLAAATWILVVKKWQPLRKALNAGAWLTLGLMVVVLGLLSLNFDTLFDRFHRLFFSEGSWLFFPTDTLIRLFPLVFWRDAFILVLGFALVIAIVLIGLTRKRKRLSPPQPVQPA